MKLPLIVQAFHWPRWSFSLCAFILQGHASVILSRKFCSIPSTKPVWCLSPLYAQNILCDFSWDNHHLPCSILGHSPVHKQYPQQLQFTDLVVLPVEFKDKEVRRHGESCWSRGSPLGETGMEVEKVGWDLLGMSEELEKYHQQLSQLSVAASLWSGILYILWTLEDLAQNNIFGGHSFGSISQEFSSAPAILLL